MKSRAFDTLACYVKRKAMDHAKRVGKGGASTSIWFTDLTEHSSPSRSTTPATQSSSLKLFAVFEQADNATPPANTAAPG
jgi:hypothetical protein